ncbi:hypothetical protein [Streptomyces blattellae]|nr:hypothetical protein [Streptomyces blattellae]
MCRARLPFQLGGAPGVGGVPARVVEGVAPTALGVLLVPGSLG